MCATVVRVTCGARVHGALRLSAFIHTCGARPPLSSPSLHLSARSRRTAAAALDPPPLRLRRRRPARARGGGGPPVRVRGGGPPASQEEARVRGGAAAASQEVEAAVVRPSSSARRPPVRGEHLLSPLSLSPSLPLFWGHPRLCNPSSGHPHKQGSLLASTRSPDAAIAP